MPIRELDEALGLTDTADGYLQESRTGRNIRHHLIPLIRQSIYSRLAGYDETNDAQRLAQDPAMRVIVGWQGSDRNAASTSEMGRFETETLTQEDNLKGLARMNFQWVAGAMAHTPHLRSIIRLVGSVFGPEVDVDDPELLASAQVEISIYMLSALPCDDASRALDELVGDDAIVDWRADLERAQYLQRVVRRDASYRHPSVREVRHTLSNLAPSNAGDLAVLLTDKLNELAIRIRTTNTDDWLQYWNEDSQGHPLKPKREEHCRDALLSDLRRLLP